MQMSQSCRMASPRQREAINIVGVGVRTRWLLLALALLACAGVVASQVGRIQATLARSATHALARTFGPDITVTAAPDVRLLPRPHVVLSGVRLQVGALPPIEIASIEATQSLGSLLSGRLMFSKLRLVSPRISLDADALGAGVPSSSLAILTRGLPGRIVMEAGILTLRSRHAALQGVMTDVDALLDGFDRNGTAVVKGHGTWRGTRLDLTARVEPFFDFVLGRDTAGAVALRSPLLTASVEGRLHAGIRGGFEGEVTASTPSLPGLLRAGGLPSGLGHLAEQVSFSGSGVANPDTITFSNARVGLDATAFEGSLAWQPNGGHWSWTGTFAADTLDLSRGLAMLPVLHDRNGRWSDTPWTVDPALLGDVDLRISASRALLGPIAIEDAAFSVLCRDGRVEAGFSEARSLDGLIRGRAVAAVSGHEVGLRVDLSLSQMDLDPLAQTVGTRGISGTASGHLVAEARGTSPRALVESLDGHGQLSVRNGSLPALPSVADLSALGLDAPAWLRSRATLPFDLATADLHLAGNRFRIVDGRVVEPGEQQSFTAEASLLDRSFTLMTIPAARSGSAITNLAGVLGSPPRVLQASAEAGPWTQPTGSVRP